MVLPMLAIESSAQEAVEAYVSQMQNVEVQTLVSDCYAYLLAFLHRFRTFQSHLLIPLTLQGLGICYHMIEHVVALWLLQVLKL
jgi:hypothetical protein